jgi:hypothetical protein
MICSYINPDILINLYNLYEEHYNKDHLLLSFKAFARFPSYILRDSPSIKKMISGISNCIEKMNPNDLLDMLYWARRFNAIGLKSYTYNFLNNPKLINRISELLKNREFNVRLLINLYCNVVFI